MALCPFGTFWRVQVSFYTVFYTPMCLSSLNFTHLLVEKDCEWLTFLLMLCCNQTKPNRLRYSTKNLTWNSEHMMIFSPKKNISFFQLAFFFSSPILNVCQFISEQRCNIPFFNRADPSGGKRKMQILKTVNFHGEIWIDHGIYFQKKLRVDERSAKTMIALPGTPNNHL